MADENDIARGRQLTIRRELDRRQISLKAVSFDSGIPYSTLLTYFPGDANARPSLMSAEAIYRLCKALPLDLMSVLVPTGFAIVALPDGIDHDELERAARDYLACKGQAHHPASEAGREIGPGEALALTGKAVCLRMVAA